MMRKTKTMEKKKKKKRRKKKECFKTIIDENDEQVFCCCASFLTGSLLDLMICELGSMETFVDDVFEIT